MSSLLHYSALSGLFMDYKYVQHKRLILPGGVVREGL
jgi:hypothetical protein